MILPRILARKDFTHEVHILGIIPRDGPFLSRILVLFQVPLENWTARFDPNFPLSRGIDFLG